MELSSLRLYVCIRHRNPLVLAHVLGPGFDHEPFHDLFGIGGILRECGECGDREKGSAFHERFGAGFGISSGRKIPDAKAKTARRQNPWGGPFCRIPDTTQYSRSLSMPGRGMRYFPPSAVIGAADFMSKESTLGANSWGLLM